MNLENFTFVLKCTDKIRGFIMFLKNQQQMLTNNLEGVFILNLVKRVKAIVIN